MASAVSFVEGVEIAGGPTVVKDSAVQAGR